jgi:CheY-like chemotaxis protein
MVALAFHDRGIDVTAVGNGEAAVRRLPDLNPDLILADIFMPVRNGYELCEWVKRDPKFSHIPVILLVGAFDPLDEKEARRVGADGVLKKPFIPPDPLIAMVTSALEKNFRIAAETAKSKEPVAAPAPAPVAAVETPAKIETAVVLEFPEPSAEDASLAYGFGSGRRTLDDEGEGEPVEALAPKDEEPEEGFEGASTTNDWRRSAMEFEIPEETSRKPAFSSEEDPEPTFASEKDIPPSHIRIPDPVEEIEQPSSEPELCISLPTVAESHCDTEIAIRAIEDSQTSVSEPIASVASELPADEPSGPEVHEVPAVEAHASPEPSFASKAAHWMDLMASPSERSKGDWFTSTFASRTRTEKEEIPIHLEASTPSVSAEPPSQEFSGTVDKTIAQESVEAVQPEEDEPFFADEPETNEPVVAATSASDEEPAISNEPEIPTEAQAIEEPTAEIAEEAKFELISSATDKIPTELVSEACDEPSLAKDPELIEPPAVHVTPEPLLIDESPRGSLTYGARDQEIAPPYSFLLPKPQPPAQAEVTEEPLALPSFRGELSVKNEDPRSSLESPVSEFDERIPTGPLPDHEALAEIPFLNPPSAFRQSEFRSDAEDSRSDSPATVDAIVQKLLERIEPQIRDLLSQNVLKPLVENLLQSELEKKDR